MKKKISLHSRKALSVFMAVLMVFSMFALAPEMFTKAEAATAGSYYVKVTWQYQMTSTYPSGKPAYKGKGNQVDNANGISIFYSGNNGTNTSTSEVYWDIVNGKCSGSGSSTAMSEKVKSYTTGTSTATISGFPTSIYASVDYDSNFLGGNHIYLKIQKIEVGASASSTLYTIFNGEIYFDSQTYQKTLSLNLSNNNVDSNDSSNAKVNKANTVTYTKPYASSISWTNTALTATVPTGIGSVSVTTKSATVKDQYGVEWYQEPYYALSTTSTPTTTNSTSISGVTRTTTQSDTCTVTIKNAAKTFVNPTPDTTTYQKSFYVTAYLGSVTTSDTTKVTLTNCQYTLTPDANGGTLDSGTEAKTDYYGFKYGISPSASRTGYTFVGFYPKQYPDSFESPTYTDATTQLSADTQVTADTTWYAAWQANQYTATFYEKTSNTQTKVFAKQNVYYSKLPTEPTSTPPDYDDGDYHYTFANWPTFQDMTQNGAEYTANYTAKFIPANYSALEAKIAEAQAIINNPDVIYDQEYSESSRNILDAALANAVTYDESEHVGRTQQSAVDAYTSALDSAIKNLGRAQYSVVYINRITNAVMKVDYPVYNKDALSFPADPADFSDGAAGHYHFTGWEPASDTYDLKSVTTNMVIFANFDLVAHNYTSETIPSNCTSAGRTIYTCACGYSYETTSGSFGDHVWETEFTTDIQPTCIAKGSKSIHCSVCGAKRDITELPALGHDYFGAEWTTVLESSCTQQGFKVRKCNRCGYNDYATISAQSHDYDSVVTPPTCNSNGYTTMTCSKCGDVDITDITPVLEHIFVEETDEYVAPTCTGLGQRVYYCSLCNTQKVETVSATGHTWADEATVDFEPTCEKAGQKSIKCTVCGTVKGSSVEIIDALGHDYPDDWTVIVDATCKGEGVKTKECSRCDAAVFDKIPATGHDFNTEPEVLVEATCGVNSVKKYHCANGCGEYIVETGTENYTHTYGEWSVTPATCTAAGSKTRTCTRCGNVETEVISMVAHSYTEITPITATCTMPAGTRYKCATCDSTYTVYSGDANGHDLDYTVDGGKVTIKCRNCTFEKTFDADVPAGGGHNWVMDSETPATCTAKGSVVFKCIDSGCTAESVTVEVPINPDAHDISTTVTPPTCTEKGKVITECSRCDYEDVEEIDAKGHTYSFPGTVTKTATCQENGVITYTCIDCDATMTETIDKIGHVFEATAETYAATCVAPAYTVYKCKTCDEKVNVTTGNSDPSKHIWTVDSVTNGAVTTVTVTCTECDATKTTDVPAGHNFNKSEIISPAKCNSTGLVRLYCGDADCDYTIDVELMTVGHNYVAVYTAPTCLSEGSIRYICSDCGVENTASAQVLPAVGHTWGTDVVSHKDPTCLENGYDEYKCIRCNDTHREVIAKLGHDWVENTALYVAPTCKTDGKRVFECSRDGCDAKVEIVIDFDANTVHNYEITTVAPTCAAPGFDKYVCLDCGDTMYKNMTPATGVHSFTATDIPATCTTKGGTHFECSVCHMQYDVLDGDYAEHTWAKEWTVDTEPTCTQNGSKSIRCTVCGAKGNTAVILKLPHSIDMSTPVNAGAGENYTWLTFKCRTCDYSVAQFTIFAKDENGNAIPGAKVTITDSKGEVEKSGNADENGYFCTENTVFKSGNYTVTVAMDDNHKADGVLTVARDGSVSGSIGHITKSVCGHLCHKNNFIGRLIRSICTFFSAKFNRTIKCCDDMEWYGKYAEGLK